jgi:hypothetical protein
MIWRTGAQTRACKKFNEFQNWNGKGYKLAPARSYFLHILAFALHLIHC